MNFVRASLQVICALVFSSAAIGLGQSPDQSPNDAVRVTLHPDGSRTIYKFDNSQRKAVATTTDPGGKVRETIRYELDDAGRFSSAEISGPDSRLRFKSRYKYDDAGRLLEETQSAADGTLLHKLVYSYDGSGRQIGYSVFDASGKLVGGKSAGESPSASTPKARDKGSRQAKP
jgi:YD repeat-containing protein